MSKTKSKVDVDQVDVDVAEVDEEAPRAEHMSTKM
jgi:hypothetical protein